LRGGDQRQRRKEILSKNIKQYVNRLNTGLAKTKCADL